MDLTCPMCSSKIEDTHVAYRGLLIVQLARIGSEIVELEKKKKKMGSDGVDSNIPFLIKKCKKVELEIREVLRHQWPEMFR